MIQRQKFLIAANIALLGEAAGLLQQTPDHAYRESAPGMPRHRAGVHMRHVLEYYECFLDQFEELHIDYAARRRDITLETDRESALNRIGAVTVRLKNSAELLRDYTVWVRMENDNAPADDPYLCSSTGRELQSLASHTVHHFALMRLVLEAFGAVVPENFGVAPSTQSFFRRKAA